MYKQLLAVVLAALLLRGLQMRMSQRTHLGKRCGFHGHLATHSMSI
ncbi:hypothetical protein PSTAB_0140 [Stutzerimonas stutzeri]|uniref:Uncharacterized protein n=1 Tax=Stutzerimonas stutzeri (strain ATCC 17588 / DSM 5190 / CCUG 11256 / JCM 5965 / LMG 11199 / NBRC 14165 / NCIMB 11358 / Stanier 221) TaxID=96563 RepID=F8H493_STUS2|nr:hypothetical protein [Stutzerimonas stutzeri]AEJ03421.1 hypothetical protein PSTAB_0140 [Stutzerimonas stutzeri]